MEYFVPRSNSSQFREVPKNSNESQPKCKFWPVSNLGTEKEKRKNLYKPINLPVVVCLNESSPLLLPFIYLLLFFLHSSPFCIHLVTGLLLFIFSPLEFSLILLALLSSFIIFKFQLFTFALSSVSHVIGMGNDKGKLKKKKSTISVRHSDLLTSFLLNKFLFLFSLLSRDNGTC